MRLKFQQFLIAIATTPLLWATVGLPSRADSPITSTPFADAYQDYAIVKRARQTGILDLEMAEYLSSDSTPVDIKAALINALSWKLDGKENAKLYQYFLGLRHGQPIDGLDLQTIADHELFALGYLTIMDDYDQPQQALPYLEAAQKRQPQSYTVAMITALANAQVALSSNWCQMWQLTDAVIQNKALQQDLRPQAQTIILGYMQGYAKYCEQR